MSQTSSPTETIALAEANQPLDLIVERVARSRSRILVENDDVPVAAVISAEGLDRLDRLDAEREADIAVFHEIGAAFRDVDPEEIERETAKALAEVRAEVRAEWEGANAR